MADGDVTAHSKSAVHTQSRASVLDAGQTVAKLPAVVDPLKTSSFPDVSSPPVGSVVFQNTPSAPTDVSTAIVSSRFITLTWARPVSADDTNINGYSVYYKRQDSNR